MVSTPGYFQQPITLSFSLVVQLIRLRDLCSALNCSTEHGTNVFQTGEVPERRKEEMKFRERSSDQNSSSRSPALALTLTNLSLSNEQKKDEDIEISGLTDRRFYTSPKTLAPVLGSMVGDTLKYTSDEKRDLVQQFSVYFLAL